MQKSLVLEVLYLKGSLASDMLMFMVDNFVVLAVSSGL